MEVPVLKHTGERTDRNISLPSDIFGIAPQ